MPMYVADFNYQVEEWGSVTLEANDLDQAEEFVHEHIREAYPDITSFEVQELKELVNH